jgi:serine/threonine-protein kinase
VPEPVEAAVLTALEKLPADRFASAAEFADALEGKGSGLQATVSTPTSSRTRHRAVGAWAAAAGAVLFAGAAGFLAGRGREDHVAT